MMLAKVLSLPLATLLAVASSPAAQSGFRARCR
jgi:hypothetical protein